MRIKVLLVSLSLALGCAAADTVPETFGESTPVGWSDKLAKSEISRRGKTLHKDGAPKARWDYTTGLFAHSLVELGKGTGDPEMTHAGMEMVGSFISPDGSIATYKPEDYNIDMVTPGRVVLAAWEATGEARYKTAAATLRGQLEKQPRTSDGGFWHKQRYPSQMWLDGLYMGSPFLARYGRLFDEPAAFEEVVQQIVLMDRHAYDRKSGLHFHGWDEKREQPWADPQTGLSKCFWGRSIGWYAMAMVDCLDDLPPDHPGSASVREILHRLAEGVVRHQDPATGLWWQVVDQGGREGNYLETSASSMFVYALAKGINRGHLDRETFLPAVVKGYTGLIRDCLRKDEAGNIHLMRNCEVAGLGYTSASGRARDGTFEYYISEPVIENDLKGVGPFILAGIEMGKLASSPVRGWEDVGAILARIRPPVFPNRDFPITGHGARPGADATAAIRAAIDACHAAGGGRVVIPPGDWPTGSIHLKSHVNLHVSKGATLRFSTNPADYPLVFTRWEGSECMNHSALIYACDQQDIAITGEGTLDGQADWDTWWSWNDKKKGKPTIQQAARDRLVEMNAKGIPVEQRVFGEGSFLRPNFIQLMRCENILIEGVAIVRSPMWEIHPVLSKNITVRKVSVISHGTNNDGCDPESCRDVLIEDCLFDTGDDCIAIKSGRNNDGRRVNVSSENIVIRRCVMKDGHGGVVLGSEISGSVRNVFIEDCRMDSPNLDRALRFKSNAVRGGVLENVFMRNVRIGKVAEAVLAIDLVYEEGADGPHQPVVRNVLLENITSEAGPRVLLVRGFKGAIIDSITIRNSKFQGVRQEDVVEHAGSIRFDNVSRTPAAAPPDAVVSPDGSGGFTSVQEAINKVPQTTMAEKPWTILVKPGTYKELVHIQREKRFVRLVGEDPQTTTITYNLFASMKGPDGKDIGTFRTPSVLIDADDFTIENLTLENSAGPVGQALAVRVDGDRVIFRNCRFLGHQDTVLLNRGSQYFENCTITGTVDFIFGGATAWFERCTLHCLRDGYITAASTPVEAPYGFVFSNCAITAASPGIKVYLGRPWRPFASTIFLNTQMDDCIRSEGWHNWGQPDREKTTRYSEISSTGPGGDTSGRVPWTRDIDSGKASEVNREKVLSGWRP